MVMALYLLFCKNDARMQVMYLEQKIDNLSVEEIKSQYGEDLSELYSLFLEGGYNKPDYTYVKLSNNQYLISIDIIKYGPKGEVLDSKGLSMIVDYKGYFGIEVLDLQLPIINKELIKSE